MRSYRIVIVFCVAIIIITFTCKPAFAAYAAPYQIRMVLFRVLDFFGDLVDQSAPPGSQNFPRPTLIPPNTNPPLPTGTCPFQTVATLRECVDTNCSISRPITDFDNNQQYGTANDLRIVNKGDSPDTAFPFGNTGKPGESWIVTANQQFPTEDNFQRGDPIDIKVFLDANKDGIIDNDWQIFGKTCESSGPTVACPNSQTKYFSTVPPLDTIQTMIIDCNVNLRYGWLLKKANQTPGQTPTPMAGPTLLPLPTNLQASPTPGSFFPTTKLTQVPTSAQQPSPTPSNSLNQTVQSALSVVSAQTIQTNLQSIVDDDDTPQSDETQTRYSGTSGNDVEAIYIKNYFESLGLSTKLQPFTFGSTSTNNIVATLPGKKTDEFYLITAHMDSTAQASGTTDPAPGADDNGSGTVMVMEAAKALKQVSSHLNYSVKFVLFSGEEEGLKGSYAYVNALTQSEKIKGVINVDMIGNPDTSGDCVDFGYKPYNGGNVISDAIVQANKTYSIGLITSSSESSEGRSDHKPFWDAGIPAIFGHECTFSSVYHSINDKTDKINFAQIEKTAKAIVAGVITLDSK